MKLDEFRLETYDERATLLHALSVLQSERLDHLTKATAEALLLRLSRTQCQPGGCDYCEE